MAANSGKGTFQPDSDVHISYEDQQRINVFARFNAKLEDLKVEVKVKEVPIRLSITLYSLGMGRRRMSICVFADIEVVFNNAALHSICRAVEHTGVGTVIVDWICSMLTDRKVEARLREEANDLKSLEDACDEIALFDEDEQIPYLVGEVFIYQNLETTQKCLDEAKEKLTKEISELKTKADEIKDQMSELKAHLYGKFGSHINLEADE